MKKNHSKIDRRNFLKTVWAAGLSSVLGSAQTKADANEPNTTDADSPEKQQKLKYPQMPRRKLGKTGVEVPCLALGGGLNYIDNQIILEKALDLGVSYWDTAHWYAKGTSELGIGEYLARNPDIRKELFIATKASGARKAPTPEAVVEGVEERLQTSLKRMNTEYIDLYFGVHMIAEPAELTSQLKDWANSAKQRKLIRFFGVSTHENMAKCLAGAAKLDWIDAIMTTYNFRLMQDREVEASVEACYKAGIGLIAMKAQGHGQKVPWLERQSEFETEEDKKLVKHFLQKGFTAGQAKIKVILQDKRFTCVCAGMENIGLLTSNVAAVLDKTELTRSDLEALKTYAEATCSGYCAGCSDICDSAQQGRTYVSDIMRYLMYYNAYGERDRARHLFSEIPSEARKKLLSTDYSFAEARCPQHLPIGRLIAEAASRLGCCV
ncbi:MAG: aldo/keto reductase [Planctomycetota bacterium]|nr:MAG: aldo/keto reductase [Planctomycetota bacterium]